MESIVEKENIVQTILVEISDGGHNYMCSNVCSPKPFTVSDVTRNVTSAEIEHDEKNEI